MNQTTSLEALKNELATHREKAAYHLAEADKRQRALEALGSDDSEQQKPNKKQLTKVAKSGLTEAVFHAFENAKGSPVSMAQVKAGLGDRFGLVNLNSRLYQTLKRLAKQEALVKVRAGKKVLWKIKKP